METCSLERRPSRRIVEFLLIVQVGEEDTQPGVSVFPMRNEAQRFASAVKPADGTVKKFPNRNRAEPAGYKLITASCGARMLHYLYDSIRDVVHRNKVERCQGIT